MSLRLYIDQNVRIEITLGLRERGIDVLSVHEDGMASAPDPDVLDRATKLQRVLFTHDRDFLAESAIRQANGTDFPGVVYAHPMAVTIGTCISDLELLALLSDPAEVRNRIVRL